MLDWQIQDLRRQLETAEDEVVVLRARTTDAVRCAEDRLRELRDCSAQLQVPRACLCCVHAVTEW